ncbi:wax ester/triacylglycerol synthase family O-acyltransferase [Congregibacter variabilis]|uniref:diacylglycerol O-acyltransferase n=1 Tax=Congregibacter variabilis TaxID=3081200 RepID=A0ABZ0I4J3_9GAMM|nr:wax ester/triacylglycerol synthase family O-acyltransferase [Congregibacter sp. IMCC43200]
MRRIDLTSAGFLLLEKRETPMHVGGVNLFTLPDGADEQEFLSALRTQLRDCTEFRKPFGDYVVTGKTGLFWEKDEHIDMDYHVRHSALPSPGRYRELFALASRLHTTLLDRTRPLWELHIIEGLQDRQFAVYNKIHHAAIDGVGAMHITQAMCTEEPSAPLGYAPYSQEAYEVYKQQRFGGSKSAPEPNKRDMRNVLEALKQQYDSSMNLATAMRRFGLAFVGRSGNLAVPWHNVPKTSINTRVSGARRFVAQTFAFERVKNVCKSMDATVNDVVLAMCAGALRRYLLSRDELPLHSLKAMAPVSLREEGDLDSSNAIGFITADMATNVYDPEKRLRTIQKSMRAGKDLLKELSPAEAALFMQLTQLPALLTSILGLGSKFPAFSTVVSNVPGPRKPLYWNGARLDGMYPASIVFDGFAMNMTLVSYHDQLDFGIVACRRSMPQIQRIIDHLEDALVELELVAGVSGSGRRAGDTRKTAAAPAKRKRKAPASKTKAKAKPKAKAKTKTTARKTAVKPKLAKK